MQILRWIKKKIRFLHKFSQEKLKTKLILILILKNNSNSNNFKENYWEKIFSFPKQDFLEKTIFCTSFQEKKVLDVQGLSVNGVRQKFKAISYLKKLYTNWNMNYWAFFSEFFREGLHRHCSAAFLKNTSNEKNSNQSF
jgi:hypothetical protein